MPWQLNIRAIAIASAFALAFGSGWMVNGWRLESKVADIQKKISDDGLKAETAAREKERILRSNTETIRRTYEDQISNLNGRLDTAIAGLLSRPSRAEADQSTGSPQVAKSCDGSQLFREDGNFLVREAARADLVREAYKLCITQYETVKSILEQTSGR